MLAVAQRFVTAASSGSVSGMGAVLHPNVVAYIPQRPAANGKDSVIASIRDGMSQGGPPPTFGSAQIGSRGIYAPLVARGRNAEMLFQFEAGLIREIRIIA
jgi:hypothetical protein